jgi:hypothetical protein
MEMMRRIEKRKKINQIDCMIEEEKGTWKYVERKQWDKTDYNGNIFHF